MTYYVIMENDCAIFVARTEDQAREKLQSLKVEAEKKFDFEHAEFYGGGLSLKVTRKRDFAIYYRTYEVPGK